jgi:hypothetical protein
MSHLIALVFNDQFKGEEARVPAPRASELGELEHDELTMGTPENLSRREERKR